MSARQTRLVHIDRDNPSATAIAAAAAIIRDGGLVVFPTETVYGLGADALNASAVHSIFEAKGRPSTDPLIVHVGSMDEVGSLVRLVPAIAAQLADRFWPGALTLILPKMPVVPDLVTAGLATVAIRVPVHPVARALIAAAGRPIAAPSANRFSRPSPTDASHVLADLDGRVDMIVDAGRTAIGLESTILDLTVSPPVVRRPGGVSIEDLRAVVPDVELAVQHADSNRPQVAPGQLLRHYAPRARMTLIDGTRDQVRAHIVSGARTSIANGSRVGILAPEDDLSDIESELRATGAGDRVVLRGFGSRSEPERAARELFDAIRTLDAEAPDEILAIAPPAEGIGLAIRDRLIRASEGRVLRVGGAGSSTAMSSGSGGPRRRASDSERR